MPKKFTLFKVQNTYLLLILFTPVLLMGNTGITKKNTTPVTSCYLHVNAGDDVQLCGEEMVTLTATVEGISSCAGGCEYPIEQTGRCNTPSNISDVWLVNDFDNGFVSSVSKFETYNDGTARYTATASNGTDTIEVDITYTDYTTTPPMGSPKLNNCDQYDTSDWVYWATTRGTITSELHGVFQVTGEGPAMQMGNGADVTRDGFGASGWLQVTGGDGFYERGDVNVKLGECIPIAIDSSVNYQWSTTDGTIVGDANQITITVTKGGTYVVTVMDCEQCEVSDEVKVVINTLPEVNAGDDIEVCTDSLVELTATASANAVCPGGCEYPIEQTGRCNTPSNISDVWLVNDFDNGFVSSVSKFETYDDGTARYTATASNGTDTIEVDITCLLYTSPSPRD